MGGGLAAHDASVGRLVDAYRRLPPNAPVRLGKATTNLFRPRAGDGPRLDVSVRED